MANCCTSFITIEAENNQDYLDFMSWWKEWMIDKIESVQYLTDLNIFTPEEQVKRDVHGLVGTRRIRTGDFSIESGLITCESAWSPFGAFLFRLAKKFNVSFYVDYEETGCNIGGKIQVTPDQLVSEDLSYDDYVMAYEDEEQVVNHLHNCIGSLNENPELHNKFKNYFGEEWDKVYKEALSEI